jgi:hypothetical protein
MSNKPPVDKEMKLTNVMKIWEELVRRDLNKISFPKFEAAVDTVIGVVDDIPKNTSLGRFQKAERSLETYRK